MEEEEKEVRNIIKVEEVMEEREGETLWGWRRLQRAIGSLIRANMTVVSWAPPPWARAGVRADVDALKNTQSKIFQL